MTTKTIMLKAADEFVATSDRYPASLIERLAYTVRNQQKLLMRLRKKAALAHELCQPPEDNAKLLLYEMIALIDLELGCDDV